MTAAPIHQRLRKPILTRLMEELSSEPPADEESRHTVTLISGLLQDVVREGASDVHLDPRLHGYQLRLRIDGALTDTILLEQQDGARIVRSFKSHAGLEPATGPLPQDGRAEFRLDKDKYSVRVATAPSTLGEKLAVRLLPGELSRFSLDQLGLTDKDHFAITTALNEARGMVVISGPTGSGKTTSAYALLNSLQAANQCVITIEDPVEYVVEIITQISANPKAGLTFAVAVKGLLRLDPDVILMGEMRDPESARAALEAADSGHIFLTTLHARDGAGTITALRNHGLRDHEIAGTLDLVVAQRLVRRLCTACRKHEAPTEAEATWLRIHRQTAPLLTWHAVGCEKCGKSGYRGRVGIFEVVRVNEELAQCILDHADERTIRRQIRESGTLSLFEDDLKKAAEGLTTIEEMQTLGGLDFFDAARVMNFENTPALAAQ